MNDLAAELSVLRRRARLSQDELAKLAGVGRGTVKAIERGTARPKPETLQRIANGLAQDADGVVDKARETDGLARLMEAAGYSVTVHAPIGDIRDLSDDEVKKELERRMGSGEAAVSFLSTVNKWQELSIESQRFLLRALDLEASADNPRPNRARRGIE